MLTSVGSGTSDVPPDGSHAYARCLPLPLPRLRLPAASGVFVYGLFVSDRSVWLSRGSVSWARVTRWWLAGEPKQ